MAKKYKLSYLPMFDSDIAEVWQYIVFKLKNPDAAYRLIADTEAAIQERLQAPESFEKYNSNRDRTYPYYRISIRNFTVWYVVIGGIMEVRRFLYKKRNAEEFL
ncbi:MAG: type II toxin-antitoxin system RelE/ParE family toxin [Desulfuromonadales bacterium]|nr:type II toxin-antitoxin system RelE/ParE family toxin [Desulfuromonadales bacterium]